MRDPSTIKVPTPREIQAELGQVLRRAAVLRQMLKLALLDRECGTGRQSSSQASGNLKAPKQK